MSYKKPLLFLFLTVLLSFFSCDSFNRRGTTSLNTDNKSNSLDIQLTEPSGGFGNKVSDDLDFGDFDDFEYDDTIKDKILTGGGFENDGNEEVAPVFGSNLKISVEEFNSFDLGDFSLKWGGFGGMQQSVFLVYYNDIYEPVGEIVVKGQAAGIDYYKEGLNIPSDTRQTFLKEYGGYVPENEPFTNDERIDYQKKIKDGLRKYFGSNENIERVNIKRSVDNKDFIVSIYMNPDKVESFTLKSKNDLSFSNVLDKLKKRNKDRFDMSVRLSKNKKSKFVNKNDELSRVRKDGMLIIGDRLVRKGLFETVGSAQTYSKKVDGGVVYLNVYAVFPQYGGEYVVIDFESDGWHKNFEIMPNETSRTIEKYLNSLGYY